MTALTTFSRVGSLDPRDAAAKALESLLLGELEARVGGGTAADRAAKLREVHFDFPLREQKLQTPCASIEDISVTDDDFDPELDDDAFDHLTSTAPMVTETSGEFQLDLWGTNKPERRALKAALLALFRAKGSINGKERVVALPEEALPPQYRDKGMRYSVRLVLSQPPSDVDDGLSAESHEWQAQARIAWDAELVTVADVDRMDLITQSGRIVTDDTT